MATTEHHNRRVLVGCPDARPPAYQAVIGLTQAGLLDRFVTAYYYDANARVVQVARRLLPRRWPSIERTLQRRSSPGISADRVLSISLVDLLLRLENRSAGRPRTVGLKRALAQTRTRWFDRKLAQIVNRCRPSALLVFSDVASRVTLPLCRRLGIPTILSMVHGEVHEEQDVLACEVSTSPDFFPIYLGDGVFDREELAWLHQRRLEDIQLADLILVPSNHIAERLIQGGISADKVRVIPYAADSTRFTPQAKPANSTNCTFLFAGGITQRKGVKYLLEAWRRIRQPGWKLQLLGALPQNCAPLEPYLHDVEVLGQVRHADMPAHMAAADVFVFPSLFEGSAVVTYEALASGLPLIVTPSAGSVVRDGIEGHVVPPRDVDALAGCMKRLGESHELRQSMARAARARALEFDWHRYHANIICVVADLLTANSARGFCMSNAR